MLVLCQYWSEKRHNDNIHKQTIVVAILLPNPIMYMSIKYPNDPMFTDRQVWVNNTDPGSTLFAMLSASFGGISLW